MAERPPHDSRSIKKPRKTEERQFPVKMLKGYQKYRENELRLYEKKIKTFQDKKITVIRHFPAAAAAAAAHMKPGKSTTEPQSKEPHKVFNDPIHGHVELHPLLVKIINTPQFERLRHIRQLGAAYYVFPGACHNRFEHSIGVAHLAGEFAKALKSKQPELNITEEDILCVQIAGLCHDLGHGPFSHLFDGMFIPKTPKGKEWKERHGKKWKHEENSLKMFDHMVAKNNLEEVMKQYNLKPEEDIKVVKEMMTGEALEKGEEWPKKRQGKDMSFLYEIVANHTNEIDVDKFDYFARDCHHLGIQNHFDHQRFFLFARVCEVDGRRHICVRNKEVHNLYEMFYARCNFHRKAYQHKVNKLIETMIKDALLKADKHIKIKGSGGEEFTLSEAIDDMEAYTKLTDQVFEEILHSPSTVQAMVEAKEILNRIISRDLYKCVGEIMTETEEMTEMVEKDWDASFSLDNPNGLRADDFAVVGTSLNYGDGENDPIKKVYFYSKEDPDNAKRIDTDKVSRLLPEHFSEKSIRIYFKKNDEGSLLAAEEHFKKWCSRP